MMTPNRHERLEGGLLGLLVGDALGVPYEFKPPSELPAWENIEMTPPKGFYCNHSNVPPGTWSDDGSQALCFFASLRECGGVDLDDLGQRLIAWMHGGYMAVDSRPFDVGLQTCQALTNFKAGVPPEQSGMRKERSNGNGSLMRVLPLALLWIGDDESLVHAAHKQSLITHGHLRSQVCCALYCLWARRELEGRDNAWELAVARLREIYGTSGEFRTELEEHVRPEHRPEELGQGYVVSCLHTARIACMEHDVESILKRAISFGNDTDTSASVAGGIAGIRHGVQGIPERWWKILRGKDIVVPLIQRWLGIS
ncbi:MAG: ADP-ribosylglycohydrolase family protein [Opitutales bacterium]